MKEDVVLDGNWDEESWLKGYFAGVRLHGGVHIPGISPRMVASLSVPGVAGIFEWLADISGTEILSRIEVECADDLTVSYSLNGRAYTSPVAMSAFLAESPQRIFGGLREQEFLWFRFRSRVGASLTFTLYGYAAVNFSTGEESGS